MRLTELEKKKKFEFRYLNSFVERAKEALSNAANNTSNSSIKALADIQKKLAKVNPKTKVDGPEGKILDLIASVESGGSYTAVYPGSSQPEILNMTIEELYADMRKRVDQQKKKSPDKSASSASGRYQYIRKTLVWIVKDMGIDPKAAIFDENMQDKICIHHLKKHGLDDWKEGKMKTTEFLHKLSKTWAGIPNPETGQSYYKGVGDNQSHVTATSFIDTLDGVLKS